jgi:DnaJ-domain-containing protein 1
MLESLQDASISFHPAVRPPREALPHPLGAEEFLRGRRRARPRVARADAVRDGARFSATRELAALAVLGLDARASHEEIRVRYRTLVRACHPDLHTGVSAREAAGLNARLSTLNDAYRTLIFDRAAS